MRQAKAGTAGLLMFFLFFTPTAKGEAIQRTVMKVDNLSCGYCLSQINAKLKTTEGYLSMEADLQKGIVAVDHRLALESREVATAISSIGYPAHVISETEIDEKDAFIRAGAGNGVYCGNPQGCNINFRYPGQSTAEDTERLSRQGADVGGGCCRLGNRPARRSFCGGSSSAWQEIRRRFLD